MGLWGVGTAVSVYRFAQKDDTQSADAAVVLGAAVFRNRPSPVLRERINHAIKLYEDGIVNKIIFTGGLGNRDTLTEAEASANYAMAQGVPAAAILLEMESTTTRENLINTQQIAAENNINSFLIVSTPFHMKRAMAMAEALDMDAYTSPTRTTQWISWFTKSRAYAREVVVYALYLLFDV
ncbi:MAG: YdcF family protein [Chloroflexi bacterium]|nr:YdcF family protein [Chloroflexota bacterium]